MIKKLVTQPLFNYSNLLSLAGWFLLNGENALAIRTAEWATTRPGIDDRLWTIEGLAYARSGRPDLACPLFEKALQRNPRSVNARDGYASCRSRGTPPR